MESDNRESFPDAPIPWFLKGWTTTLVMVVLFLVLTGATAFLLYEHHQSTLRKHLEEDRSRARLLSILFEEYFDKVRTTMESYVSRPLLVEAAKGKSALKAREHLEDLRHRNPHIEIMVISDRYGTLWASSPPQPGVHGKNYAYRDWYRGVSRDWKPYVSRIALRTIGEKDPAVHIAVPLRDEKGMVIGVLLNTQRTVALQGFVERLSLESDASISVVDRSGHIAYSTRYPFKKEIVSYPFLFVLNEAEIRKEKSFTVFDPYPDEGKQYVSFATVRGIGWHVFVSRSARSVIFGEWKNSLQIALITALLFLMIGMSLIYFRRQVITTQTMDRLLAERRVRESETRYAELFSTMTSGVAVYRAIQDGEDFIVRDLNDAARRITGVQTDFIGKNVSEVFPGIKNMDLFSVLQRVWRTGKTEFHPSSLYSDGRLSFWAENRVYKLPSGEVVSVFDDVTERKDAENSLRRQADRLRNLHRIDQDILMAIESTDAIVRTALMHLQGLLQCQEAVAAVLSPDGTEAKIFSTRLTGNRVTCSKSVVSPDEKESLQTLRQGTMEVVEDTSRMASPSEAATMFQPGGVRSFIQAPLVSARGLYGVLITGWEEPRTVSTEEAEITGEVAGQVAIAIEQARLLQEMKRQATELEERVRQRTAQLEVANRELEAFAYSVSHDLRAPLRHINGYVDLLVRRCHVSLPEKGRHYLDTIADSAREMGVLIDDLLQFSRTSRQEMRLADLDMNGIVEEVVKSIKADTGGRTIEWDVAKLPNVCGDHSMVRLVWSNLIGNAVKFTRPREKARIKIGFREEGGEYVFLVRDNGVGFDMQYAAKLFGVFQRLHSPEDFEGTGIGLANVHRIISRHDGRVWAEAEPGKGALFCFTLPKTEEAQP